VTVALVADVAGSGPAVVALHGQPGSAADWAGVVPLLRGHCTIITPDRLGYGRTGGRATGFATNATAVLDLLDRLEVERAVVVGHSWGGGVALAAALRAPQRIAGMVLVASVSPLEPVSFLDRVLAVPPVGTVAARLAIGAAGRVLSYPSVRAMVEDRVGTPTTESVAQAWRQGGMARSFALEQRALVDELGAFAGSLGDIATPVAVVIGTADRIVAAAAGERLAAALPTSELIRVPGAGHLLPLDHPDVVAHAIESILGRGLRS
jgi:pimeloyl-ACP methyl ester carboxylesterase